MPDCSSRFLIARHHHHRETLCRQWWQQTRKLSKHTPWSISTCCANLCIEKGRGMSLVKRVEERTRLCWNGCRAVVRCQQYSRLPEQMALWSTAFLHSSGMRKWRPVCTSTRCSTTISSTTRECQLVFWYLFVSPSFKLLHRWFLVSEICSYPTAWVHLLISTSEVGFWLFLVQSREYSIGTIYCNVHPSEVTNRTCSKHPFRRSI